MLARWEVMLSGASRVRFSSGILTMAMLTPSNQQSVLSIQPAKRCRPTGHSNVGMVRVGSEHEVFDFNAFCQALPAGTQESQDGAWPEPGLHPKYKARDRVIEIRERAGVHSERLRLRRPISACPDRFR